MTTLLRNLALSALALMSVSSAAFAAEDHCAGRKPYVIYYATHAIVHPVWATVHKGAIAGAADNCLTLKWTEDPTFSVETTINRMEAAIAEKPDMLIITATDPVAMRPTIEKAKAAGIPVIAINTLDPAPKDKRVPYLIGIGASMYESGVAAAQEELKKNPKPRHVLVPDNAVGHVGLDAMAKGFIDTMKAAGATGEVIALTPDSSKNNAMISNYLLAHQDTDGIFCMESGPICFEPVLDVVRKEGLAGKIALSSFDISPALLDAIKKGEAVAGIDQLMYMQGYLPAVLTRNYLDYGMMPATDILTGPAVIDAGNIDKVKHRVMEAGIN
jgi:simple sugar transport system substrate-binding protein